LAATDSRMPPKATSPKSAGGAPPKKKLETKAEQDKKKASAAALEAFKEKERAKKEAAAQAEREWLEEKEAERLALEIARRPRPKSPGRRREPDKLTRVDTVSKLRENLDEANIHAYALNGEEDKLREMTNLRQDKEGKNFIRFLDSRDRHGNTALMNACWKGHLHVVRFLVEAGASINLQNYYGWTAMMWAVNHNAVRVVDYLIEKSADLHIVTPVGRTAVEFANDSEIRSKIQKILDKPVEVPKEILKIT